MGEIFILQFLCPLLMYIYCMSENLFRKNNILQY